MGIWTGFASRASWAPCCECRWSHLCFGWCGPRWSNFKSGPGIFAETISIIIILPFSSSGTKRRIHMESFNINDAVSFRLATQQEDTGAKVQVFFGVLLGVILRWIVVDVIKNQIPQNLAVIIARIVVALIATIFVFSGYWQKVKDQPASMRFLNALVYGISIDALVGPWTY